MNRCQGGWCDWCPVKIQIECEEKKMTPIERIEHIRQCVRRMKPTMGFELAAAAEIEKELVVLDESFDAYTAALLESRGEIARLSEKISRSLNGDTCG